MIRVMGIPFLGKNQRGDFNYMIGQEQYKNALFIYNANFIDVTSSDPASGGGSACIQPYTYKKKERPQAVGIPTGWSTFTGGFQTLNVYTKNAIECGFGHAQCILQNHPDLDLVIFSCDKNNVKSIGQNIFTFPESIVNLINTKLYALANARSMPPVTHAQFERTEKIYLRPYAHMSIQHALELEKKDKEIKLWKDAYHALRRGEPTEASKQIVRQPTTNRQTTLFAFKKRPFE